MSTEINRHENELKPSNLNSKFFVSGLLNNTSREINKLENELKPSNSNSKFFVSGLTMRVQKSTDLKMN